MMSINADLTYSIMYSVNKTFYRRTTYSVKYVLYLYIEIKVYIVTSPGNSKVSIKNI